MNNPDEGDDVGALLRSGYASDANAVFAAALLARMQQKLAPRPRHLWAGWAAVAAGLAILGGVAAILHFRHPRPSVPVVARAPSDEVGPVVVRGRLVKWDAPIAEFVVSQVIHGKLDAKTVQVDLTPEPDAVRNDVRAQVDGMASTESTELQVLGDAQTAWVALLGSAAGKDMVLELGPVGDGPRPRTKGRVLSWGSVTDLPPRGQADNGKDMVLTVVVDDSASAIHTLRSRWPTDEWGMPR